MTPETTAMKVRGVSRTYRDGTRTVQALEGTDIDIPDGKFVTIVGPSACGKSTLLNLFCGLDKPDAGSIETPALGSGELLGRVGYMPQQDTLMPWRTVTDNAAVGLECPGCGREEARKRAREHMARFGLDGFELSYPGQLSGGMRQRWRCSGRSCAREESTCSMSPSESWTRLRARRCNPGCSITGRRTVVQSCLSPTTLTKLCSFLTWST